MILDTGCTKAMCSRHAYLLMRQGLSEDRVELLPDSSTFNFANGQKALAREKCRIWFSYEPPLFTDFSIIDEGKVPFLDVPSADEESRRLPRPAWNTGEDHIPYRFPERTRGSSSP